MMKAKHYVVDFILVFLKKHWPSIAIVLFVLGLHWDMVVGAMPATGDHMIHMYRGWLMAEHMIPSGRLNGWSNMAFAGYPAGVYYPILGDLLVAGFHYLTFCVLTWERTYTLCFLFLLVMMPLSVYAVTRRIAGQSGSLIAAMLSLGDVGGWPQGGHISTVLWAVWPYMLGLTLSMFSVLALEGVMSHRLRDSFSHFLLFVFVLALAILAHPMTFFFVGLAGPVFVVAFLFARRSKIEPTRAIGRTALAALFAVLLTLFWTLPWITSGGEWTLGWPSVGFGGLWYSLPKMVHRLVVNKLFKNFYWIPWGLGLAGIVLSLISRRLWPTFLGILLVLAFVISGLVNELGDTFILRKVQIERMAAFMKFIWFALAGLTVDRLGFGVDRILFWIARKLKAFDRFDAILKYARIGVGPALAAALVLVGWKESYGKVSEIGRLGGEMWQNIVKAEEWLGEQPRGPLDRILYQPGEMCIEGNISSRKCDEIYHRHIFASGPIRTNLPKLKFGYEATAIFRNLPVQHRWPADSFLIRRLLIEPEALVNLHVRWIVSIVEWPKRPDIEEVKKFGDVTVYSVESGELPPVRIEGGGKLKVERFSDEEITVNVEGAGPESRILYPIAYYYPWRAYHDGEPIGIETYGVLPGVHKILMSMRALNGTTDLRYERPRLERLAGWISLFTWISMIIASAVIARRRFGRATR
jgi:hypothetical protein